VFFILMCFFFQSTIALNQIGWHSVPFIIYDRGDLLFTALPTIQTKATSTKTLPLFFLGYERNYWKFFITWKIEVHRINKFRRTSDVKKKVVWNHLNLCEILRFGKFVLNKYRSENDDKKMFSRNFEISLVESHYYFILLFFEPKFV